MEAISELRRTKDVTILADGSGIESLKYLAKRYVKFITILKKA